MAYIQPRRDKSGNVISYFIRVHRGRDESGKQLKPYSMTWKPAPGMSSKQIEKELKRQEVLFEKQCKDGLHADNKQTFARYAAYVMELKANTGVKRRTLERYGELLERVNEGIGHIKLIDIKPQHLNELYRQLSQPAIRKDSKKAVIKPIFAAYIKDNGISKKKLSELSGVSFTTVATAFRDSRISEKSAQGMCNALNVDINKYFTIFDNEKALSSKTIREHHDLISTILSQAEKEMLITFNPARKATPPKLETKEANYFNEDDVERIRDCLEEIPLKWKTIAHLLLISGARRAEIAGLKWDKVDWKTNQVYICNNLLYLREVGIYEDTTKTEESTRWVRLPLETMELLQEYRQWYIKQLLVCGNKRENSGFLFVQENGKPMNPNSITDYCKKFSQKYNLPHINPHAFRHTMVSILYFKGVDSVSISRRLGHSKVSTTTDKYGHIMKKADERAAECIADVFLRKDKA